MDTIFALSSGTGTAGIAVIRVAGDNLQNLFRSMTEIKDDIKPRFAYLTNITTPALPQRPFEIIDHGIVIYFAAPNSFTGTDVIEFYTHGSRAVIQKLFDALRTAGARMAAPGEFTRIAFDNNKMDLTAVDAMADLINARTERQRTHALQSMLGRDTAIYENWRAQMVEIAAFSAAYMDYADDELPKNLNDTLRERAKKLHDEIARAISLYPGVSAIQNGFNIAIVGPTNAGKSSLFNRLVGHARAIVSDTPGTTRDVVSAELDMDGYLVNLSDTAGLRDTNDAIESIGIARANAARDNADFVLRLTDAEFMANTDVSNPKEILVINKCDLMDATSRPHILTSSRPHDLTSSRPRDILYVSATTGAGIPELIAEIKRRMHEMLDGVESDVSVNARTHDLLTDAERELSSAIACDTFDLFSEHVRHAADDIGKILGTISANEIMDATFGRLCLGK